MNLEERIRKLGQKRDSEGLHDCLSDIPLDELLELVQLRLTHDNFIYTWSYILQGFSDTPDSHKKRIELVMKVLQELEKREVPSSHSNTIIRHICMELGKFKVEHLLKLCDFCIECLQSQRVSQLSWKELLPELLNVLGEKECVEYNDEEIEGIDCKHQLINTICMIQWSPSNVTSLAEMFIDTSLTKEEHQQVVNKLGKYLEKLTPQEIPAFVYQLLRLCKQNNSRIIFMKLQQYFGLRYKDDTNTAESNSDNTEFDAIEDTSSQEISEAESTVFFHIHTSASLGQECIKDYLGSLKNMLRSPEYIIHPFQLSVLFTISTISHYEEKVFEIIRSCISRTYNEEQRKTESAWFREMVPNTAKIESVFTSVITTSAQDRDLILQGLVNFAFVLLRVGSALGRDPIAEKQWQLGNMILFKIIKRKRHTAPVIIEQLSNRVLTENTIAQYIECLYMMSKHLTLLMLESKSIIVSLMEGLSQISGSKAKLLLDVIIPLTKVSPTIRDHFILLLRKALYSRSIETRQVAVIGFLKLLSNLKISDLAVLSQSSSIGSFSSGHSLFTQISMSRASQSTTSVFSNESLCLEVLTTLKRCFMQQAEIRIQLYTGLYNAVCLNPELGIPALEMIWSHFRDFYNIDEETLPPLKFEKITVTRDVTVFLQEPLGNLIYSLSLIVANDKTEDSENSAITKFGNILESLSSRMIKCELVHLELDDGTDLTDIMPEAQHKLLVLKEAISVYEALMGYKFHSWELESENNGTEIVQLFQGYTRLTNFLKSIGKPKKSDKKKKDANKSTQQSQNTTIKKDGQKSSKALKVPDSVLDFQVIKKILSLLHEPTVPWTTIAQSNMIKTKREFHQYIMQATVTLVTSVKNKKFVDVQIAKRTYDHLCDIAVVLYERIIKRLSDFIDFDCTTAVLALECFLIILNTIANSYRSNFHAFLSKVGGRDVAEDLVDHLTEFVKMYEQLFELDEELSEDPEMKKVSLVVINTLHFLVDQIPPNNNALALQVMDWVKNHAVNNTVNSKSTAQVFVNLLFDTHLKFKVSLTLFEQASEHIGDVTGVINEEEHDVEEFKVINELTVNNVFISLCSSIKSVLEDVEWIIARLRAEHSMIMHLGEEGLERRQESLKNRERGICCQLCFIVTILTNLSNCTVPPGSLSEATLKNLSLLYSTIGSLAKYFVGRSSKINPTFQAARFERLVKLAGKQLAPVVYKLITYIEESQKQNSEPTKTKKKNVDTSTLKSKVLKETRLIPKVIYELEQFSKFVLQLSKKTNIDLSKYIGQGTVRDFRIMNLKEVLEQNNDAVPAPTQDSEEDEDNVEGTDEETSPPPSKKRMLE